MLPDSLTTIREDLRWSVAVRRPAIQDALAAAKSKIHLTCNAWTSSNSYAIWRVQAIFLDLKYRKQDLLIGLERLRGDHRGETQAGVTLQVADEYRIAKSLGYVVMDNASSNDMLARTMELILKKQGIKWDSQVHKMQCLKYIVNLAVSAFIYSNLYNNKMPAEDASIEWKRFGALGKLHNIVVYTQHSPQRYEAFKELLDGLRLQRDNKTQWNSWFKSIERTLKLKQALQVYYDEEHKFQTERLSPEDWDTLTEMQDFLKPFYDTTLGTEGVFNAVNKVLPAMEYLLEHLKT